VYVLTVNNLAAPPIAGPPPSMSAANESPAVKPGSAGFISGKTTALGASVSVKRTGSVPPAANGVLNAEPYPSTSSMRTVARQGYREQGSVDESEKTDESMARMVARTLQAFGGIGACV
jgi:hypothetical protein